MGIIQRSKSELVYSKLDLTKNNLLYEPGEEFYGAMGPALLQQGWSTFPQMRDGRRLPARVDGETLKWGAYINEKPLEADVDKWALQCPSLNVALILGASSGNTFAIDIDILDREFSDKVRDLADEILGKSGFRREGQEPKLVLIYRYAEDDKIQSKSFRFINYGEDGVIRKSDDGLEILGSGKPVTIYGIHHKTGRYFMWLGSEQPLLSTPEDAPIVTSEMITTFLSAVEDIRPFHRTSSEITDSSTWDMTGDKGVIIPLLKSSGETSAWIENEDGLVSDGRETFLFELCKRIARSNAAFVLREDGVEKLIKIAVEQYLARAVVDDKRSRQWAVGEIKSKMSRAINALKEGKISPISVKFDVEGKPLDVKKSNAPPRSVVKGLDSLEFIPRTNNYGVGPRKDVDAALLSHSEEAAAARALIPDRKDISKKVQEELVTALDAFFGEVYVASSALVKRIHILKAPTGAGKTTRTIRYIAEDERTKQWDADVDQDENADDDAPGPIVFLLPTYNNIAELRLRADVLNLDGSLSDAELGEIAMERGLIHIDELETKLADLRRDAMAAGLRTMVYKGKIQAGCQLADKVKLLSAHNIGSGGLCRSLERDKDGEITELKCTFYETCEAIQQRKEIAKSHVVFTPHAFFTLTIPEELKKVRAVIADERIFHMFLHTTTFMLSTLLRMRRPPKLTKKERDAGEKAEDLLALRDEACRIAMKELQRGGCPANALNAYREALPNGDILKGLDLVKAAKRVCGSGFNDGSKINPTLTLEEIKDLCSTPTGTEISEEYRFWKLIEERIELLEADIFNRNLHLAADMIERFVPKACGDRDMRIQFIKERKDATILVETVRISWRVEPNWKEAPLLLLDASASPEIIAKIFSDREVVVHDIDTPLNVRTVAVVDKTYSNYSIVARPGAPDYDKTAAARIAASLRRLIANTSALYGWSRVVVGGSVIVRRALNSDWVGPSNVDWCHFGAMRGLDFAKNHAAAISLGRMEVPIRTVDGIVAALTYDDIDPEDPYDKHGDSLNADGTNLTLPYSQQTLPMRSGHDMLVAVPTYPGAWAKIVQRQYREEELKQFVGRLRPVYREGEAPVWFAVSRVIPDNVIVDDVINLDELLKGKRSTHLMEAVRVTDGIIHPELIARARPELYKSIGAVKKELTNCEFDHEKGFVSLERRGNWGFSPVSFERDGAIEWAFVRAEIKDPIRHLVEAFKAFMSVEIDPNTCKVGKSPRAPVHTVGREADWVDEELGTRDDREMLEHKRLIDVSVEAFWETSESSMVISGAIGVPVRLQSKDKAGKESMNVESMSASQSTAAMWERLAVGHDTTETSPVLQITAEYEHLAGTSHDADGG